MSVYTITYGSYTIPAPATVSTTTAPEVDKGTIRGRVTTLNISFVLTAATDAAFKTARDSAITNLLKTEQNLTVKHGSSTVQSYLASELWLVSQPSLSEPAGPEKSLISSRMNWTISFTELTVSLQAPGVGWVLTYEDTIQERPNGLKSWVRRGQLQSTTVGATQRFQDLIDAEETALKTPDGYQLVNTTTSVDQTDRNLEWSLTWDQRNVLAAVIVSRAKNAEFTTSFSQSGDTRRVTFAGTVEYPSTEDAASSATTWLEELEAYFDGHPLVEGAGKVVGEDMRVNEQKNTADFSITYEVGVTGETTTTRYTEHVAIIWDLRLVDYDLMGPQAITVTQQAAWPTVTLIQTGSQEHAGVLTPSQIDAATSPPGGVEKSWRRSGQVTPNVRLQSSADTRYSTTWSFTYRVPADVARKSQGDKQVPMSSRRGKSGPGKGGSFGQLAPEGAIPGVRVS